jgi:DNA-binding transcriptional regulator YbjK
MPWNFFTNFFDRRTTSASNSSKTDALVQVRLDRMEPGSRQRRGIVRRQAILDAAVELLLARGMAAVTHRAVADAAQTPLGAIRYYFHTREALLLACLESVESEREAAAGEIVAAASQWARAPAVATTAELLVRSFMGPRLDDCTLRGTIGWFIDSAREGPALAELLDSQRRDIDTQLAAILAAAGLHDVPVGMLCSVMDGALVSATVHREANVAQCVVDEVARLLGLFGN